MVVVQNHLGKITLTNQFFTSLISSTVTNCFGVVGMNACNTKQTIIDSVPFLKKRLPADKGVSIRFVNGKLYIDLHITVMYGVNVAAVVKSIQHKVRFVVEDETEYSVEKINVYIDGLKN